MVRRTAAMRSQQQCGVDRIEDDPYNCSYNCTAVGPAYDLTAMIPSASTGISIWVLSTQILAF
eukprot:COSAG01_NODE_2213_length_8163_cov_18.627327_10_plen_63_part_00